MHGQDRTTDEPDDRRREALGRGHLHAGRALGPLRPGAGRVARGGRRPAARPVLPLQGARADGVLRGARRPRASSRRAGSRRGRRTTRRSATTPTATWSPASRSAPARSGTGCRWRWVRRSACAPRASTARVVVLVGDAELDEGSNHEAIELAGRARAGGAHRGRDRQPVVVVRRARPDRSNASRSRAGTRSPSTAATTTLLEKALSAPRVRPAQRRRGRRGGEVMNPRVQFARTAADLVDDRPVRRARVRRDLRPVLRRGRDAVIPTGSSTSASASSCWSASARASP